MSKHWERDLLDLQRDILTLAAAVEGAVHLGVRALRERDLELARRVVAGDAAIDQEENRVEDECLKMLALHQPVAGDLRRIIAALKINTDLERMADLAVNIAERVLLLAGAPRPDVAEPLQRMADLTTVMVRRSLDAFVNLDAPLARQVIRLDDEADRYNREIIDDLVRFMRGSGDLVVSGLALFSVVRQLERIADHATNIAEDVIYLIEGEIVRHQPAAAVPPDAPPRPPG